MKKIILSLILIASALSGYSQMNTFGGIGLRVNDTTTYQTNAASYHTAGYRDIYFNNQATTKHFDIWNGSSYDHIFSFGGSGGGGGSGTVNSGTSGQLAYYASTGAAVSGATTGTGVVTALGVNVGSSGAIVVNGGALGTPSSGTGTNITGIVGANVTNTPAGNIAATNTQSALNELDTEKTDKLFSQRTITGTDAIIQSDNTKILKFNSATPFNFTIDALTAGTNVTMQNDGAGTVTFINGSGVTFSGTSTLTTGQLATILYDASTTPDIISGTGSGGSGTVTNVSFTGGLISVANATTTPSLTVAGTSGGIPYFSGSSTWASSAALAANAIVIGGGAGSAPSTTTTGTGVLTALGVNTGSSGAFVVNGGALGTPSSGTATNLTGTATGLTSGITNALKSATTTVDVSAATAPSSGQVLTATSGTAATWQTPASGFANPMTTLGDIMYEDATPTAARLAGNTTSTRKFLSQTGNGTISAVPSWLALVAGDIPALSYWALTGTSTATGAMTISGGTSVQPFTFTNTGFTATANDQYIFSKAGTITGRSGSADRFGGDLINHTLIQNTNTQTMDQLRIMGAWTVGAFTGGVQNFIHVRTSGGTNDVFALREAQMVLGTSAASQTITFTAGASDLTIAGSGANDLKISHGSLFGVTINSQDLIYLRNPSTFGFQVLQAVTTATTNAATQRNSTPFNHTVKTWNGSAAIDNFFTNQVIASTATNDEFYYDIYNGQSSNIPSKANLSLRIKSGANGETLLGAGTATTTVPHSTLNILGSFAPGYVAKTANYTATISDYTIECTANTFQVTLPTAVGIAGRIYYIVNSGAGTITIGTTSSQTFVNVTATPTTLTMATIGTTAVQSNGANWMKLSGL